MTTERSLPHHKNRGGATWGEVRRPTPPHHHLSGVWGGGGAPSHTLKCGGAA
jgi:hypothetical protein